MKRLRPTEARLTAGCWMGHPGRSTPLRSGPRAPSEGRRAVPPTTSLAEVRKPLGSDAMGGSHRMPGAPGTDARAARTERALSASWSG